MDNECGNRTEDVIWRTEGTQDPVAETTMVTCADSTEAAGSFRPNGIPVMGTALEWRAPKPVEVFCGRCKTSYPAGTKFCGRCGIRITP